MEQQITYKPLVEEPEIEGIVFSQYKGEGEIAEIKALNDGMLSEAYSVYTYHYFVKDDTDISYIARNEEGKMIGVCMCKKDMLGKRPVGYIGMLSVIPEYRGRKISVALAIRSINAMIRHRYSECMLETELTNTVALTLYEKLGFRRTDYLTHYYENVGGSVLPLCARILVKFYCLFDETRILEFPNLESASLLIYSNEKLLYLFQNKQYRSQKLTSAVLLHLR